MSGIPESNVAKNGLQGLVIADSKLQDPGTWRHLQGSRPINRRLQGFGPINRLKNATRPPTASGPIHDFCNIGWKDCHEGLCKLGETQMIVSGYDLDHLEKWMVMRRKMNHF